VTTPIDSTTGAIALVVEADASAVRGVLFARVEGRLRFICDATCSRGPSLSAAVEELAVRIAGLPGLAAGQIQRDPLFVVSDHDDLAIPSLQAIHRQQAIAHTCAALARERGATVACVESRAADGFGTLIRAEPGALPSIATWPVSESIGESTAGTRLTPLRELRALRGSAGGEVSLLIAAEPFTTMLPGVALLALADIVGSAIGRLETVVDRDGLSAAGGALDDALASVVALDLLPPTGLVLAVDGDGEPGMLAARGVVATRAGGRTPISVPWGSVQRVAVPSWQGGNVVVVGQGAASIGGERIARQEILPASRSAILLDARGAARHAVASETQRAGWLADVSGPVSGED